MFLPKAKQSGFLKCSDHITHIVQARLLFCKVNCCIHSAVCKNIAGVSGVLEGDHLIRTAEQHFVITHDAATAHGTDTNFLRVALLTDRRTIIHIVI